MTYWWVNQGQTYAQEREGGYLWSPKRTRNGGRRQYYDNMTLAQPDDLIFHYVSKPNQRIESLSAVASPARSQDQPSELRHTDMWDEDGWLLPVRHVAVINPISRAIAVSLGAGEAPFTRSGTVNQGYLYELSDGFGARLLDLADPAGLDLTEAPAARKEAASPKSEPSVETVPLEAGQRLEFDQVVTASRRAASRGEWMLVEAFVEESGVERLRRRYDLADGTSIYADLYIPEAAVLIEAKNSASRSSVREAIGQLHDYAHKEDGPVSKVMLLPEAPAKDLLPVLDQLGIVGLWPGSERWSAAVADVRSLSTPALGDL